MIAGPDTIAVETSVQASTTDPTTTEPVTTEPVTTEPSTTLSAEEDEPPTFADVVGLNGTSWDVTVVAMMRGMSSPRLNPRGEPTPCLAVFGVLRATSPTEFSSPLALPVTATVGDAVQPSMTGSCVVEGVGVSGDDPYGFYSEWLLAPGAEIGFNAGFTEFEGGVDGELPDSLQVAFGASPDNATTIDLVATEERPPVPDLAIGTVPDVKAPDTIFDFTLGDTTLSSRLLGYDIVPADGDRSWVRLFVRSESATDMDRTVAMSAPRPYLVADGVRMLPFPGGCDDLPDGYFFVTPLEFTRPARVPFGLVWCYEVPTDTTVQAVTVEDDGKFAVLAVEQLDGPPPAP